MKFLGLRLDEHDSSITYTDGTKVKYYKLERDNQIKHAGYDNFNQWISVVKKWVDLTEIDVIGMVIDCFRHPWLKANERKLYEFIDIPYFKRLGITCPVVRIDHHYAHSLSHWPLGIESDIEFVLDGYGNEQNTTSVFKNDRKIIEYDVNSAPSLGFLMGRSGGKLRMNGNFNDHAGKVMALKGYGNHTKDTLELIKSNYNEDFTTLDRVWDVDYLERENDAGRGQDVFNHVQFAHSFSEDAFVKFFCDNTKPDDVIAYSGGVAQNTIINTRIKQHRPNLFIPPHCNDEGLTLGIVEFLRQYYGEEPFDTSGYPYWQQDEAPEDRPSASTTKEVAQLLASGKIIGWYQGHGECGPRALGNRSILMNPALKDGKETLNDRVKHREWFRPFGASILEEKVSDYFDWNQPSPYMLYVMDVLDKESFPAITHVDGTCRPQTVTPEQEDYYNLISEFENLTGVPMVLNTSLNNGGKAICGNILDAMELLCKSEMDALVVGNTIYEK